LDATRVQSAFGPVTGEVQVGEAAPARRETVPCRAGQREHIPVAGLYVRPPVLAGDPFGSGGFALAYQKVPPEAARVPVPTAGKQHRSVVLQKPHDVAAYRVIGD